MKRLALALGLAASATLSSAVALADEPVVGPPALEDKPLVLRDTGAQPQQAAPAASSSITLLKGLGVAGIGVVAFALFKRKRAQSGLPTGATVKIVARTSLGMRTEVCVVEVGGERLVLGVTPTTVTTLSVLGDAPAELGELTDVAAPIRAPRIEEREIERATDRFDRSERNLERADRTTAPTARTIDRARAALDEATEVEPMSALTRLLETARRRTEVSAPTPTRQRDNAARAAAVADDDDAPVDIVPPRAPAPRKTTASRRIEEQVRGLNTPRSRRAS